MRTPMLLAGPSRTELLAQRCEQLISVTRFLTEWLRAIERKHGKQLVESCKPADVPDVLREK